MNNSAALFQNPGLKLLAYVMLEKFPNKTFSFVKLTF